MQEGGALSEIASTETLTGSVSHGFGKLQGGTIIGCSKLRKNCRVNLKEGAAGVPHAKELQRLENDSDLTWSSIDSHRRIERKATFHLHFNRITLADEWHRFVEVRV